MVHSEPARLGRGLKAYPSFVRDVEWFIQNRPDLVGDACYAVDDGRKRYVLSIADPNQFQRLLQRISDPEEFLSPYGIRSLSKYHQGHPFQFTIIMQRRFALPLPLLTFLINDLPASKPTDTTVSSPLVYASAKP